MMRMMMLMLMIVLATLGVLILAGYGDYLM